MALRRCPKIGKKVGYTGPQATNKGDFHIDETREIPPAQMADWEASADKARKVMACDGG